MYDITVRTSKHGWLRVFLTLALLFSFAFGLSGQNTDLQLNGKPIPPGKVTEIRSITSLITRMLVSQHYSRKKITPELSEVIFEDYIKRLDPMKMYFLQSEIDEFSKEKNTLGVQLMRGDVSFAFRAFNLLLHRTKEYRDFALAYLESNPSLYTDESIRLDHEKAPWCKTKEELQDFWRKKVLHELIILHMTERSIQEEQKEKPDGKEQKKEIAISKKTPEERIKSRLDQTVRFYSEMEAVDVLEIYLTTVTEVFDPHSSYMSPRTDEDFNIDMSLSLIGIGATLTQEDGYTKVVELVPGGPAEKCGKLKAGDRIIAVQQEGAEAVDVVDMRLDKVVQQIRGKEDTWVTLTILPSGAGMGNPQKVRILRKKVELKESAAQGKIHEWKGKRIGVIYLPSFYFDFEAAKRGLADYRAASNDVKKLLIQFKNDGVDGVVIDLRSNGGGSLREAIMLTGLFIAEGPVVQVRDKKMTEVQNDEDDGEITYNGPLAVMINRFSASSSEIFAAAIKDYNRGIITGDRKTHGKGTVQFVNDLGRYMPYLTGRRISAGAIRLTNAKFYRINGESTQLRGVDADIAFPSITDHMDVGEDKLDHPLSWDTIMPTDYRLYRGKYAVDDSMRMALRIRSMRRIEESDEFKRLKKNLAEYEKVKNIKTLSLNLDVRWKEYQEQKKIREEEEKLSRKSTQVEKEDGKKQDKQDLYLDETLNILVDMMQMAEKKQ